MAKWRKLVDVLGEDSEILRKYINYKPNSGISNISFERDYTGWKEEQSAEAEILSWHPVLVNGEPCLINEATEFTLFFQGLKGYVNIRELLEKYSKLYCDIELGSKSEPLMEKVYNMFPESIQNKIGNCWLDDYYQEVNAYGVKCVFLTKIHTRILYHSLEKKEDFYAFPICMIIHLPHDIMVKMDDPIRDGSCLQKALKISNCDCECEESSEEEEAEKASKAREEIADLMEELDTKELKNVSDYIIKMLKEKKRTPK